MEDFHQVAQLEHLRNKENNDPVRMSSFRACKNLDKVNENIKIQNPLSIVSEKIYASN